MTSRRTFLTFVLLASLARPVAAAPPAELAPIVANRTAYASEFAGNAAMCVQRHDTRHAAFHGCIDWHSSVHGTWALVAYGNETGDGRYDKLVAALLNDRSLRAERRLLAQDPSFEMPYGRAWLLRLAMEYEERYRSRRLRPLADLAARSIHRYLADTPVDVRGSYNNSAWAAYNLLQYYRATGQDERLRSLRALVVARMLSGPPGCAWENPADDFLSHCSTLLLAASEAMPRGAFRKWLGLMDIPANLSPFEPGTDHGYGVNYSRSWALLQAYAITKDQKYASAYARHFTSAFARQAEVRGDYGGLGHWVSQFGMLALQPVFSSDYADEDESPPTPTQH